MLRQKPIKFCVKVTERNNHLFLLSIWWIRFSDICKMALCDNRIKRTWLIVLHKHMKNVRSSQPCISVSWDFKHNYANSDTIRVVNDTYIQGKQYIQWSVILLIFLRKID